MNDLAGAADGLPNHYVQIRIRRLLFRCWHRGTQEMVLIFGRSRRPIWRGSTRTSSTVWKLRSIAPILIYVTES
jgi:hypothetical protein